MRLARRISLTRKVRKRETLEEDFGEVEQENSEEFEDSY